MSNYKTKLRTDAIRIFKAAVKAANPGEAVKKHVRIRDGKLIISLQGEKKKDFDLRKFRRLFILGAGKASAPMAAALEEILSRAGIIPCGVVVVKYGHTVPLRYVKIVEAGHPIPDKNGLRGARETIEILNSTGKEDLIFFLVSGGGSSLLPLPAEGIDLSEKQKTTELLLACGASIHEINTVRKHISGIKGGQLARRAYPSRMVTMVLSDVIGDDLDVIASGLTVPDGSSFTEAMKVLRKYRLTDKVPAAILKHIEKGVAGEVPETPKPGDPIFDITTNIIVGNNFQALKAAKEEAEKLGYNCMILSSMIDGEAREVARVHAAIAKEILTSGNPIPPPACVVSGGETTVTVSGDGLGGRNMEFCLAAAVLITGLEGVLILSGGTDGTDGPTDAAGALCDGDTAPRAEALGMKAADYLARSDSYHYFEKLGDLLITGPTNTNVMDVRLVMVAKRGGGTNLVRTDGQNEF